MRVIAAFFGPYAPDALPAHVSVFSHDFKRFERLTKLATSSIEALSAGVSWQQQNQPARVCRVLSVPAELSSAERLRTGGADLTGGARPCHCQQGQKGRICQVF